MYEYFISDVGKSIKNYVKGHPSLSANIVSNFMTKKCQNPGNINYKILILYS